LPLFGASPSALTTALYVMKYEEERKSDFSYATCFADGAERF
jgi:hypothetical protein